MSLLRTSGLLALAAAVSKVSAHGFVQGIDVDGTYYTGYLVNNFPYQASPPEVIAWAEDATDLGFVAPEAYTSGDIICHKNGTNAQLTATVKAGGTVRMDWNTWPESHHGPIIDYLASCTNGDCTTVDKTTLSFFKIAESGLIDDTTEPGTWASDNLISNNNSWAITIPTTIAAGKYVLRHEIIALHSAGSVNGAQNYPQCINLDITSSGSDVPEGTLGESLYTETDPGISVNIYVSGLSYTIPGPTLYSGGSGTAAKTSGAASSVASVTTTKSSSSVAVSTGALALPTTFATSTRLTTTATSAAQPSATNTPAADLPSDDDTCEA